MDQNAIVVNTRDKVNPWGLQIDGVVVCQSWSKRLIECLSQDEAFIKLAHISLDEADKVEIAPTAFK